MKKLGVLVPIVTPCSKEGSPDLNGLKALCKYFLDVGCQGIFVLGSTGRGPWFSRKDRVAICKAAREQIGSKVPFFAGCIANGLADMLENAHLMLDSGATAAVLTAPGYFNYNKNEIEHVFLEFADKSPLPFIIYDIPAFTNTKLDTDMISRLAKHENIIGFKDSSTDIDRFKQLLSTLNGSDNFYLIQGKEHILAESILNGASGLTVSLAHIAPELFVSLYNAAAEGNEELANHYQRYASEIMDIFNNSFQQRPEISTLFHCINYALTKRGICENIILEHEGECPIWLAEQAQKAMDVCKSVG